MPTKNEIIIAAYLYPCIPFIKARNYFGFLDRNTFESLHYLKVNFLANISLLIVL